MLLQERSPVTQKPGVRLETVGTLHSALTHPVLSVGMCGAQRAPQPQAAFLSDRLSSLDQPWVKVGLHLPTQGPLSLSPSPQTLLWEAVSAGDPHNANTGLGNGCWMRSLALGTHPALAPASSREGHECVRCPVGTGSQSQETCTTLPPVLPAWHQERPGELSQADGAPQ